MKSKNKIPITLLVGFLGSGKTTLLNKILTENHGLKIAVIENEFGELDIESEFISKEHSKNNENILELINGCFCCSKNSSLIETLQTLLEGILDFDHVVIESTGVADPGPVLEGFYNNKNLLDKYILNSVVTIVDSGEFFENLNKAKHVENLEFENQFIYSDLVVLNKMDRLKNSINDQYLQEEITKIKEVILSLNSNVNFEEAEHCHINIQNLLSRNQFKWDIPLTDLSEKQHDHGGDSANNKLKQLSFEIEGMLSPSTFQLCLSTLFAKFRDRILRVKGIVFFQGNDGSTFLQGVNNYFEFQVGDQSEKVPINKFIFIGLDLNPDVIKKSIENCRISS